MNRKDVERTSEERRPTSIRQSHPEEFLKKTY